MAKWIPDDPDTYLYESHFDDRYGRPDDWQTSYAHWRYVYAPGYQKIAVEALGGMNCADFLRRAQFAVPVAVELVPEELRVAIGVAQPDDWIMLPPDQLRYAWNGSNMIFAKVVLCLITLQVLILLNDGRIVAKMMPDGNGSQKLDIGDLLRQLRALDNIGKTNVFDEIKLHLATYAFNPHDQVFWTENVIAAPERVESFQKFTLQYSVDFLPSFAERRLVTIQTLEGIKAWLNTQPDLLGKTSSHIAYVHPETVDRRPNAAKRERVKRATKKGATKQG